MIEAIIFDLDGTLLDTVSDLASSLNQALKEIDHQTYSDEEVMGFVGNGVRRLVDLALNERASNKEIDQVLERFQMHYSELYNDKTKPYDGIVDVVYKAKELGFALGVCSNKPNVYVQQLIAKHFKEDTFDFVLGEVDFIDRKPAPDMALEVAANLGVDPRNCLFVGDSIVDVQTAKNANMPICAVTYGFQSEEKLLSENPEYTVHDVHGVLKIIEALA